MRCGILAFQGNIEEHERALERLDAESVRVLNLEDLNNCTHLIIPGGESTVMSDFLEQTGLGEAIIKKVRNNELKVFGTCAGAILLAKEVVPTEKVRPLGLIDITVERNAYGRQAQSFETEAVFEPTNESFSAVFIRAPKIASIGSDVTVLAELDGEPIIAKQHNVLVSTCHPEYLAAPFIHNHFLSI